MLRSGLFEGAFWWVRFYFVWGEKWSWGTYLLVLLLLVWKSIERCGIERESSSFFGSTALFCLTLIILIIFKLRLNVQLRESLFLFSCEVIPLCCLVVIWNRIYGLYLINWEQLCEVKFLNGFKRVTWWFPINQNINH